MCLQYRSRYPKNTAPGPRPGLELERIKPRYRYAAYVFGSRTGTLDTALINNVNLNANILCLHTQQVSIFSCRDICLLAWTVLRPCVLMFQHFFIIQCGLGSDFSYCIIVVVYIDTYLAPLIQFERN